VSADVETLIANADAALYRAKAEERGTARFFEAAMDQQIREKRALQRDLVTALENNQCELYFPAAGSDQGRYYRVRGSGAQASSRARNGTAGRVHSAGGGNRAG
jgi:predicted signal transduction protein with EAL and GGDEF domain